ncbi:MAG: hypothetical protein C0406_10945 [Sideroxydans sp.]|nr:hypothetical protein [Sideroxydans sp.]
MSADGNAFLLGTRIGLMLGCVIENIFELLILCNWLQLILGGTTFDINDEFIEGTTGSDF